MWRNLWTNLWTNTHLLKTLNPNIRSNVIPDRWKASPSGVWAGAGPTASSWRTWSRSCDKSRPWSGPRCASGDEPPTLTETRQRSCTPNTSPLRDGPEKHCKNNTRPFHIAPIWLWGSQSAPRTHLAIAGAVCTAPATNQLYRSQFSSSRLPFPALAPRAGL